MGLGYDMWHGGRITIRRSVEKPARQDSEIGAGKGGQRISAGWSVVCVLPRFVRYWEFEGCLIFWHDRRYGRRIANPPQVANLHYMARWRKKV